MAVESYDHSVEKPLNREPPISELVTSYLTGPDGYDRNHGPIPHIDAASHVISIDGAVKEPFQLTVQQLKSDFTQHEVTSVLQCAGNRRHTMRTQIKEVQGLDWFDGAVMNCRWRGPRLSDVLSKAGLKVSVDEGAHVAFACHQQTCQEDNWYGGSIELARVLDKNSEALLALEMNGRPLTANHGYPVRVVLPGIAGARWVKWVDRITVQQMESTNHYQKRDYKVLPPQVTTAEEAKPYWDRVPPLQEMPVNSVIGFPASDTTVAATHDGSIAVRGYAVPAGDTGPVVKVEVSTDNGNTWTEAEIVAEPEDPEAKWAWTLWRANVKMERGSGKAVLSRATDAAGNTQEATSQWNLRGVAYNGYGEASNLTIT